MTSIAIVLKADIGIPDFSSVSKRGKVLPRPVLAKAVQPGSHVIVDSTGLKVYGKDEWHQEKHNVSPRRTWRKLHLAVDENHNIIACELTTPEVGDPTAVPGLLDQSRHRLIPSSPMVLTMVIPLPKRYWQNNPLPKWSSRPT